MEQLRFSIPEILSLIGVTQCVYIIVYMLFRSGRISRGGLPLAYFFVLGFAFFLDAAQATYGGMLEGYFYLQWLGWFLGPPLGVLLIIQIAKIDEVPALKNYWVLLLVPLALVLAKRIAFNLEGCSDIATCPELKEWLILTGFVAGAVSLLTVWGKRNIFKALRDQKTGKERYWLILSLIIANIFFLIIMLGSLSPQITEQETVLLRTIVGLALIYLVNTSIFRIYPQAVQIAPVSAKNESLSREEQAIARKIEQLMALDKIYHEATYSRSDLAQELKTSETIISKIINVHFQKSFPQLINEHRVKDAKQLLTETGATIKIIAEEVGFNSLASFNRVFKEITGMTPSDYRSRK